MKHLAVASVLVVIVTLLVILLLTSTNLLPGLASEEGAFVDQMFRAQIYVIAFIFSLIVVLVLYSVVVFRQKPGDEGEGQYITGNTALEIGWTLVPLVIVIIFATWGALHLAEVTAGEEGELVVEVTGFQFGWRFDYPDAGVSSDELWLPLNRQVLFRITSRDVIHSFWVPEFRLKQDAVPGRWTELRVKPTETGDYRLRCAELCGYAHAAMISRVVVVEPAAFEAWLQGMSVAQPTGDDTSPAGRGAMMVQDNGCTSCHSVDGTTLVGPSWQGVFGSERQLEDGSTVTADEEYLRRAILDPGSQVVAGFPNIMPAAYNFLPEEDITAMVEYIKTLSR
ncbi:MAG: cytochrome c oxidase subunit II [Anaerolineaceae bacterium]|nr:cytochrome c oxidase subunit II [Anaerolineaceae bacterium]